MGLDRSRFLHDVDTTSGDTIQMGGRCSCARGAAFSQARALHQRSRGDRKLQVLERGFAATGRGPADSPISCSVFVGLVAHDGITIYWGSPRQPGVHSSITHTFVTVCVRLSVHDRALCAAAVARVAARARNTGKAVQSSR